MSWSRLQRTSRSVADRARTSTGAGRSALREICEGWGTRKSGATPSDAARRGRKASGPPPKIGGKTRATAKRKTDRSPSFAQSARDRVRDDSEPRFVQRAFEFAGELAPGDPRLRVLAERRVGRSPRSERKAHRQECLCYQSPRAQDDSGHAADRARTSIGARGPTLREIREGWGTRETGGANRAIARTRVKGAGCGVVARRGGKASGPPPKIGGKTRATANSHLAAEPAEISSSAVGECVCSFGATRVGALIERVRLHVATDRFLAQHRGDAMWAAACASAAVALVQLRSRLGRSVLARWICEHHATRRSVRSNAAECAARSLATTRKESRSLTFTSRAQVQPAPASATKTVGAGFGMTVRRRYCPCHCAGGDMR